jgi:hypothetical protein
MGWEDYNLNVGANFSYLSQKVNTDNNVIVCHVVFVVNGVLCWFKNSEHMMKFSSCQRSTYLQHDNFITCLL